MSMATTVLKAEQYSVVNIKWKWDTDGDEELFDSLPEEIVLPLQFASAAEGEDYLDDISEWISDKYGYLHNGFSVRKEHIAYVVFSEMQKQWINELLQMNDKQSYQNSRNKSSADKAPKKQDVKENEKKSENKTESKAVTAPNTPNEFYNPFTGIGTEDKQAENVGKSIPQGKKVGEVPKTIPDDVAEENKKITGMITAEKARLVNLLRKRLSFHIKLCIKTELSPREVFLLVELVSKIPPKENWNKEKFGEWSWEAERKKLLESWKSVQGNESLTKLTFDDYVKIKKEIIYYYNLVAFLYGEDVYQGF